MNTKVRRFEPGCSGFNCIEFLERCGFKVTARKGGSWFNVIGPNGGRPKRVRFPKLIDIYDQERIAMKLEPIRKRGER